MPYYRKRYGKKRYYRRRRVLSKANVKSNTSAKSQANQIIALNKRISAVEKRDRPEIQLFTKQEGHTFTNSTFADTWTKWKCSLASNQITGQWVNLRSFNIRGILEYSDNYEKDVAIDHQRTCSFRLVIWQKLVSDGHDMTLTDLIALSSSGVGYELNAIRPFIKGTSAQAKILYDKTYAMSNQSPIRRFNISLKRLLNIHKDSDKSFCRGDIFVGFCASGLHFDTTYEQKVDINWISTLAYIDQN